MSGQTVVRPLQLLDTAFGSGQLTLSSCSRAEEVASTSGASAAAQVHPQRLGHKNDFVVWLRLQPMQQRIYQVRIQPASETYFAAAVSSIPNRVSLPLDPPLKM